jgi:hypothetical protein
MTRLAIWLVFHLVGMLFAGLAVAASGVPTTLPSDESAAATTRPDIQALRDREMDCQTSLDRARADCLRRLGTDEDFKAAVADLALAQSELDQASDGESRANAASGRMAAKKHLDDLKTAALASDAAVIKAAAALKQASDSYQTVMVQDAASATMNHASSGFRSTEENKEDDAGIKEMLERGEKQRLADIKSMLNEIRNLDDQLGQIPEDTPHEPHRAEISQAIIKDRQLIARCEKLKGQYLPDLTAEIGSTGAIFGTVHVFQIIDDKNAIVSGEDKSLYWVKGFDTSKLVDDEEVEFHQALRVSSTTRYKTVDGSSKTIFVLEPFGPMYP